MFAYIKGSVTEIGTDEIIVETGGIGFSVFTSSGFCQIDKKSTGNDLHPFKCAGR